MINAIATTKITDTDYLNKYDCKLNYLPNIKKINILLGENNSSKSRLMRYLIKLDSQVLSNKNILDDKRNTVNNYRASIINNIERFNDVSKNNSKIEIKILKNYETLNDTEFFVTIKDELDYKIKDKEKLAYYGEKSYYDSINNNLNNLYKFLTHDGVNNEVLLSKFNPIYIPILRGIESFDLYYDLKKNSILDKINLTEEQRQAMDEYKENAKHIYRNKIAKAYKITTKNIFTAEDLYDEVVSKLLGEEKARTFIAEFQKFISENFFNGNSFQILPRQNEKILYVKIGDSKEKPIHELGDGIKQIITIFYKIFEFKDEERIFFIEEPEINLHPGLQRKLLETLLQPSFDKHQFFITTHSNHFIDSCFDFEDISLYKFINVNNSNSIFKVINTTNKDVEMLQLLGVNNTSVFMSNCTIWIEGISDRILIKKYLDIYFKEHKIDNYKEDINYSFVEYGGNNIAHWSFIDNDEIETINASGITNRCFLICDNDNGAKSDRKQKLKEIFKENMHELNVREIENTISRTVLEKTLFADGNIKYLGEEYEGELYADASTYMGDFIDKHYELKKQYSNGGSGTISNKLEFSKKISKNINNYEDLSEEAITICEKVYEFIKQSNSI